MNGRLSVIVPVYNVEKFVGSCITSIKNQTYQNLEIILVDDGSTDSSGSICDHFSNEDRRIKVIHKKNGGLRSARYAGLEAATSKYVTFVDGDDYINLMMYEQLMKLMSENNVDMVSSGCICFWDKDDWKAIKDDSIEEGLYDRKMLEEKIIPNMLWCRLRNDWSVSPTLCNKILKKDLLKDCYKNMEKESLYYGEDVAAIYPYILKSQKIYFTQDCYYYYRQRPRGEVAPYISKDAFFDDLYKVYSYLRDQFADNAQRDVLMKQLDSFYVNKIKSHNWKYHDIRSTGISYLFPFDKVEKGSQIIIYGAGRVGFEYYEQVIELQYCKVVLWVDKNYLNYKNKKISSITDIAKVNYDFIVLANSSIDVKKSITKHLLDLGVPFDKIVNV
nr:glycosyltransferase [uncultured Schaedlerella sp.]